jgi:hypothetical protein
MWNALEELLALRGILRPFAPDFKSTNDTDQKTILRALKRMGKFLIPIFEEIGLCHEVSSTPSSNVSGQNILTIENGVDLINQIGSNFIFIGANAVKKKLKNLGIEANKIIVAGGPMHIDDLRAINPNIPDVGIQSYQKKIEKVMEELSMAVKSGTPIMVAFALQDENDKLIQNRLVEIEQKINGKMTILWVKSWEKI